MSAADIVAEVRALGVFISEHNGKLWIRPPSRVPPELMALAKTHREEIVAHLVAFRNVERHRLFGETAVLTSDIATLSPCHACGRVRWWRHEFDSSWVCATCHPPTAQAESIVWSDGGRHA